MGGARDVAGLARGLLGRGDPRLQRIGLKCVVERHVDVVAGPSVQWPAVSTTVGEISVPVQRNLPSAVVKRTSPTFLWTCPGRLR